jgi:ElaB/YqjD/DUF883 family membrane-anchored ribosome-binding protein
MSDANSASLESQQMVTDIKSVIATAEEMLVATAGQSDEKITKLRERIELRLRDAKARLVAAEEVVVSKSKHAAKATDAYVHESPWKAVGIAAGAGLLVGLLISRR